MSNAPFSLEESAVVPPMASDVSTPQQGFFVHGISWLFAERALRCAGGFAMGVAIARYLGPDNYGRYGVAMGLAMLAKEVTTLGLDRLVRRDLALRPKDSPTILGSYMLLGLITACAIAGGLAILAHTTIEDMPTRRMIYFAVWMALPQSFAGAELWFEARCYPRPAVLARNSVWLVGQLVRLFLMWSGITALGMAVVALVEAFVTYSGIALAFRREHPARLRFHVSRTLILSWLREGWPAFVLLISGISLDRTLLLWVQSLTTNQEAGHLGAGLRIFEVWVYLAFVTASLALPKLASKQESEPETFKRQVQLYADASLVVPVVVALIVTVLSPWVVPLVLGDKYRDTVPALVALFWGAPAIYAGVMRGQIFAMKSRLLLEVPSALISMTVAISLLFYWTPTHGAVGAAWAMSCAQWAGVFIPALLIPAVRDGTKELWAAFLFPLRIGSHIAEVKRIVARVRR